MRATYRDPAPPRRSACGRMMGLALLAPHSRLAPLRHPPHHPPHRPFPSRRQFAWGHDELNAGSRNSREWFHMGLTIVDSLDTLLILGLEEEYAEARYWVVNYLDFNQGTVSVRPAHIYMATHAHACACTYETHQRSIDNPNLHMFSCAGACTSHAHTQTRHVCAYLATTCRGRGAGAAHGLRSHHRGCRPVDSEGDHLAALPSCTGGTHPDLVASCDTPLPGSMHMHAMRLQHCAAGTRQHRRRACGGMSCTRCWHASDPGG